MVRSLVLAVLAFVLAASSAHAEGFLTPFIGENFGGDTGSCSGLSNCQPRRIDVGASVGATGTAAGIEADFGYSEDFFGHASGVRNNVFTAMSNVLVLGTGGRIRSYLVSGVGLIRSRVTINQTLTESSAIGYDWGGGVDAYFAKRLGIRIDIRQFKTFQDVGLPVEGGKLSFWRSSLGLALRF